MGGVIRRDPAEAASHRHDLVIVGGGIQGVSVALEAARRGLRPLLLEQADFGGGTTWNNLRIIHGGLRYLQGLDLARFRDSVVERSWYLRNYPELVQPLPCLMPLYGWGFRRPWVLAAALRMTDLLSRDRNAGLGADRLIPNGVVIDPDETATRFPGVETRGLRGAALWFDAFVPDSQRLVIEMARWACAEGARTLNYVEVRGLRTRGGAVEAVEGLDVVSGDAWTFRADAVVNCAGPWCRELASRFDRDVESLFRPVLLFNVLLDRLPLSDYALALQARSPGARTYFLLPWKGRVLAGTYHAPRPDGLDGGPPEAGLIRAFLDDVNGSLPGLELGEGEVLQVFWGLLPAAREGTVKLARRARIHDHGARGGPRGLYSVSGVKFTTARRVAARVLDRIDGTRGGPKHEGPEDAAAGRPAVRTPFWDGFADLLVTNRAAAAELVDRIVDEEAVVYLEDLLQRRTDWGFHPEAPHDVGARVLALKPALQSAAAP